MSSRKGSDIFTSTGEGQKLSSAAAAKTKQKRVSNASDTPPGPINLAKKPTKKSSLPQKNVKLDQKNVKTTKAIKKNEKESEDSDEKKDLVKKSAKQKLKEKLVTKTVKKPVKEVVKKGKNSNSGNNEKVEKLPKPKKPVKKVEDKDEKKPKEKVQKEKKVKEVKELKKKPEKKSVSKPVKKNIEDIDSIKSRVDLKTEKKEKSKKVKVVAKNKVKLNSAKKIDDNPQIECMDVVKDENPDDVALLQVFQLKNGPVCDFDGSVCNTITIRQDNTCIKIKEISVSQLPYPLKTEENEDLDVTSALVKKESKQITENQNSEKQSVDKPKSEKQKTEKLKNEKQKSQKQKTEKQKVEKPKVEKVVKKPIKVEKKKPIVVAKTKSKGKAKIVPKTKAKGRPVSKRPRVASLNAIAKVHCLYENESKSALIDAMAASATSNTTTLQTKAKKGSDVEMPARKGKRTSKRTTPGLKSVGRHWDMHDTSSTNSSSSGNITITID